MSGKIVVLPETLTHRIAAGEVVERPASIVKELVENALDAGATEIAVELEKGGCQSIRITDNGEGIDRQDVPLAFARYATSKIGVFEDIYRVRSFGFRGEALASIASISRVEMTTRRASSPAGTRVVIEAGEVKELSDAGCPVGTSILVSRIFETVPVRRKFLKSDTTEQGYCLDVITRLALMQPGVKIRVSGSGGRPLLNIPAVKDPAERISLTLGQDFRHQLIPAAGERAGREAPRFRLPAGVYPFQRLPDVRLRQRPLREGLPPEPCGHDGLPPPDRGAAISVGRSRPGGGAGGCGRERPPRQDGGPFSRPPGDLCAYRRDPGQRDRSGTRAAGRRVRRGRPGWSPRRMPPGSKRP